MNEVTLNKVMDMVATIVAGMQANPANGQTQMDAYNLNGTIYTVTQQVTQGLQQAGISIVQK